MKEENFIAPKLGGKPDRMTLLECKNGHAFKIDWQKLTLVRMVPA